MRPRAPFGRCAIHGTAPPKICIRHGSRSFSTRRLTREPSWKAWHEVLRDRSRNLLFNYLGLGEDNVTMNLRPDCADFAYFLRAYFAFKMGLPFGYSNCSRSGKCYQWFNIEHPEATRPPPPPEPITASADPTPAPTPTLLQQMLGEPAAPRRSSLRRRCSAAEAARTRLRSANICGSSATSSTPARCERRRATTTPIFIQFR